jgi:hypothetical protein
MKFRTWLSIITVTLLLVVIVAAWGDIREAFGYLGRVDLWLLALMIPAQFISYFATGEMIFSYLRAKGNIKDLNVMKVTRMSLELNFVNHVFPSGGAAGIAYFSWLLGRHGVSSGRATMAQIIRFALTFVSFALLLLVALAVLIIDHSVDRMTILLSLLLVVLAIGGMIGAIFLLGNKKRLDKFSVWLTKVANGFIGWITRGHKSRIVKGAVISKFFEDIHEDYVAIRRDKKILVKPFIWSILANIMDVVLVYIAFWSFGVHVNPAIIFIAFGLSSIASAVSVTPGGAGVYEAVMIAFLGSAGVPLEIAIAGTLLARVLLMVGTIVFGYVFYQMTVVKYGKAPVQR